MPGFPSPSADVSGLLDAWYDAPCALAITDASFRVTRANRLLCRLAGIDESAAEGKRLSSFLSRPSQIYFESVLAPLLHIEGACFEVALSLQAASSSTPVLVNMTVRTGVSPRLYDVAVFPAPERRSFEEQLLSLKSDAERRAAWLAQLEALSGIGAWTYEIRTGRMLWSGRTYELYGISSGTDIDLETALRPFAPAVRRMIEDMLAQPDLPSLAPVSHEVEFSHSSGLVRRFKIAGHGSVNQLGEPVIQGVLQDITDAYNSQLDLWRAAHFDQITSLGNRYHFNAELSGRTEPKGKAAEFFLLIIDLDGFKAVNDTYGHRAGDDVLKEVSRRISLCASAGSFRLGGDEFALIVDAQSGVDAVRALAQHLLTDIARPIDIGKEAVCVSASIGISHYPSDGCESDLLLHAADCAMYAAKKNGKNQFAVFQPGAAARI
ncbi:MAG: hypothetical protein C0457_20100 [Polymorphum sp.]|nr:hypothetical protein [Polymorphum sp.]